MWSIDIKHDQYHFTNAHEKYINKITIFYWLYKPYYSCKLKPYKLVTIPLIRKYTKFLAYTWYYDRIKKHQ